MTQQQHRPWTLRDARRALSRKHGWHRISVIDAVAQRCRLLGEDPLEGLAYHLRLPTQIRKVDCWISKEGPDAPLYLPDEGKRGKNGMNTPSGTGSTSGLAGPTRRAAETGESKGAKGAPTPEINGAKPACSGRGDRQTATSASPSGPPIVDKPACKGAVSARAVGQDKGDLPPSDARQDPAAEGRGLAPSHTPRPVWGGETARPEEVARWVEDADRRMASRMASALRPFLRRMIAGVGQEPSPRVDSRKLVTELITRRMALSRAKREEMQHALVLILCDVSASCSATSREALTASIALAHEFDDVVLVTHSNGFPSRIFDGALWRTSAAPDEHAALRVYYLLLQGHTLAGTVAFGDADAGWLYTRLASDAPLVWLDSYAARHGVKIRRDPMDCGAHYAQGVNDVRTTLDALRQLNERTNEGRK